MAEEQPKKTGHNAQGSFSGSQGGAARDGAGCGRRAQEAPGCRTFKVSTGLCCGSPAHDRRTCLLSCRGAQFCGRRLSGGLVRGGVLDRRSSVCLTRLICGACAGETRRL